MTKFESTSVKRWNGNGAPFVARNNGNIPEHEQLEAISGEAQRFLDYLANP